VEDIFTHSLSSALHGGEWSASCPGRFTRRERTSGVHWIGGWVGPKAVLYALVKRKIPSPRRESNPRTPIIQPIAQRYHGPPYLVCIDYILVPRVRGICYVITPTAALWIGRCEGRSAGARSDRYWHCVSCYPSTVQSSTRCFPRSCG
jgi:hypothetical protein